MADALLRLDTGFQRIDQRWMSGLDGAMLRRPPAPFALARRRIVIAAAAAAWAQPPVTQAPAPSRIDTGDTAWMLISAAPVGASDCLPGRPRASALPSP